MIVMTAGFLAGCYVSWLFWLVGILVGVLNDCYVSWLSGWLLCKLAFWLVVMLAGFQAGWLL